MRWPGEAGAAPPGPRLSTCLRPTCDHQPPLTPPTHPRQLLELDAELDQAPKYAALDKWAAQLQSLHAQVAAKLAV